MGATRKLQGEIDRVLKKVQEGVDVFDGIWNKVYDTENLNQKEKFEADLKKEIKKLQRYRDQIKTWIQSSEIKDKKALVDARKLIEREMERFKVCEKETKTKAFSKEGLGQQPKTDPREKAKADSRDWLNNMVSEMESQIDTFESEMEGLQVKKGKQRPPRLTHLEESIVRHKSHIGKLEMILRLLENDEFSPETVNDIKDFLELYIERNQDDFEEFEDTEEIYQSLPLDVLEKMDALEAVEAVPSALPIPGPGPKEKVAPLLPQAATIQAPSTKPASATPTKAASPGGSSSTSESVSPLEPFVDDSTIPHGGQRLAAGPASRPKTAPPPIGSLPGVPNRGPSPSPSSTVPISLSRARDSSATSISSASLPEDAAASSSVPSGAAPHLVAGRRVGPGIADVGTGKGEPRGSVAPGQQQQQQMHGGAAGMPHSQVGPGPHPGGGSIAEAVKRGAGPGSGFTPSPGLDEAIMGKMGITSAAGGGISGVGQAVSSDEAGPVPGSVMLGALSPSKGGGGEGGGGRTGGGLGMGQMPTGSGGRVFSQVAPFQSSLQNLKSLSEVPVSASPSSGVPTTTVENDAMPGLPPPQAPPGVMAGLGVGGMGIGPGGGLGSAASVMSAQQRMFNSVGLGAQWRPGLPSSAAFQTSGDGSVSGNAAGAVGFHQRPEIPPDQKQRYISRYQQVVVQQLSASSPAASSSASSAPLTLPSTPPTSLTPPPSSALGLQQQPPSFSSKSAQPSVPTVAPTASEHLGQDPSPAMGLALPPRDMDQHQQQQQQHQQQQQQHQQHQQPAPLTTMPQASPPLQPSLSSPTSSTPPQQLLQSQPKSPAPLSSLLPSSSDLLHTFPDGSPAHGLVEQSPEQQLLLQKQHQAMGRTGLSLGPGGGLEMPDLAGADPASILLQPMASQLANQAANQNQPTTASMMGRASPMSSRLGPTDTALLRTDQSSSSIAGHSEASLSSPLPGTASAAPLGVIGKKQPADFGAIGEGVSSMPGSFTGLAAGPMDHVANLSLLDAAFRNIPQARDSERAKMYIPKNRVATPASYPQTPAPILENHPALWERLDMDVLFFAFYYQQGTFQQYLAARELKRQSWRFHKKYRTWFQRHEEPSTTTDEFEQGTYVYFDFHIVHDDFQTGWCQRIKTEFTFEYSYLEDELQV